MLVDGGVMNNMPADLVREVPQQVQDGQRLVIDTLTRVSPHVAAWWQAPSHSS